MTRFTRRQIKGHFLKAGKFTECTKEFGSFDWQVRAAIQELVGFAPDSEDITFYNGSYCTILGLSYVIFLNFKEPSRAFLSYDEVTQVYPEDGKKLQPEDVAEAVLVVECPNVAQRIFVETGPPLFGFWHVIIHNRSIKVNLKNDSL